MLALPATVPQVRFPETRAYIPHRNGQSGYENGPGGDFPPHFRFYPFGWDARFGGPRGFLGEVSGRVLLRGKFRGFGAATDRGRFHYAAEHPGTPREGLYGAERGSLRRFLPSRGENLSCTGSMARKVGRGRNIGVQVAILLWPC